MKIEEEIEYNVKNQNSRITFETTGGGSWKIWDRFISIDKQKLYHIGNVCGTCEFFFLKQEASLEVNFNKEVLIESMNSGELEFNEKSVVELSKIIPNGNYLVSKGQIKPGIVTSVSNNNYFANEQLDTWRNEFDKESTEPNVKFNNYYREQLVDFGILKYEHKHAFFNFFVPLYEVSKLNHERIDYYKKQILNGKTPIILAVGVLDVKTSEEYPIQNGQEVIPEFGTHWCLANYIIDGHHKIKAASELGKSVGLISFISRDESWKLIDEMVTEIKGNL